MPFLTWQSDEARWLVQLGLAVAAALTFSLILRVAEAIFARATRQSLALQAMQRATRRPIRVLVPLIAFNMVLSSAPDELVGIDTVRQLLTVAVIATLTWLVIQGVRGAAEVVTSLQPLDHADNLSARRLRTQTTALTRTLVTLITFIGVAIALMTFPSVRHIGTSLLASAGLAGIVAGLAARPVLGNLIAGLQIGLTQPIRLDDVVVVAGEWGRIEEITGTYVVVKIWDQRRLIVPLEWWTQNPFQNWTRSSASITGQVLLWLDFRTPLEPLRAELRRLCEGSDLWDGVVAGLQVVEASDRAMQIRCLVSSADSGRNWDLRCLVREGLIQLVQEHWPDSLPRVRAELSAPDGLGDGRVSGPGPADGRPGPDQPVDSSPPRGQ
ncbi:mechanosensitive ion channel family protein [uncultured Aquabacterium sp.]|uniref:mechanosensitive ion channel family protein n=1 Tax=Aquabacterium sp. TaxID=1872578 RepID=UPI0025EACFE9|nr:mechanosensitive ion channel family protein [uncultured Aquabacterium sp.]